MLNPYTLSTCVISVEAIRWFSFGLSKLELQEAPLHAHYHLPTSTRQDWFATKVAPEHYCLQSVQL